jgi:hypothetical protein
MIATVVSVPKFSQNQSVRFIGGEGKVKALHADSGSWSYTVEMAMGPEPVMGRIGSETTILLSEADLAASEYDVLGGLALVS